MATRRVEINITGESRSIEQAARRAERSLRDLDDGGRRASKGLDLVHKGALAIGGAFAAAKVFEFASQSLDMAVAAEEAGNKFDTVFGPAAGDLSAELDVLGEKAGIADFKLQDIVGTTGNIIQGLGGTKTEAAELAGALAPLAVDVASFNGSIGDSPEVLAAMNSALTGERDALKTLGIVISEADVQERALADTRKTSADELTGLEKAQATYNLIVERSGEAVGDLGRNADSMATKQAQLSAKWQEAQVALGQELMPALESLMDVMPGIIGIASEFFGVVGSGIDAVHTLSGEVRGLFGDESVREALNTAEAVSAFSDAVAEGEDPALALTAAVATLLVNGNLTADSLGELREATGVTADEMLTAVDAAEEWASAAGGDAAQAAEDFDLGLHGVELAAVAAIDEIRGVTDESSFWEDQAKDTTDAQEDLAEATDETTTKIYDHIEAQRAAVDPAFRAMDAARKYAEAQEETNDAIEEFGENSPEAISAAEDQAEAFLDLKADMQELKKGGFDDNRDALAGLYREMGLSQGVIDALLDQFDRVNSFVFKDKLIHINTVGGGRVTVTGGNIGIAAEGGFLRRGGRTLVGEEGPEIVDLPTGSTVYPNGTVPANGSASGSVINVYLGTERVAEVVLEAQRENARRGRTV